MSDEFELAFWAAGGDAHNNPPDRELARRMFDAGKEHTRRPTVTRLIRAASIWEAIMELTHGRIFDPRKPDDRSLLDARNSAEEKLRRAIREYNDGE